MVRDSEPEAADQLTGRDLRAADVDSGKRATLKVIGSLIDNNRSVGIHVYGSDLALEATVVRATQPRLATDELGHGVSLEHQGSGSTATVSDSVLEANHNAGMLISGSDLVLSGTRIRDTRPQASDLTGAGGLIVQMAVAQGQRASASITASAIERNHPGGLLVAGADVTAVNTVVRDSDARWPTGTRTRVEVATTRDAGDGHRDAYQLLVEGNHDAGCSSPARGCSRTRVRGTLPRSVDGSTRGLTAFLRPSACRPPSPCAAQVLGHARAGVSSSAQRWVMSEATMDCNAIHLVGAAFGETSDFDELEPSQCGCGSEAVACTVQSASLSPTEL